MEQLVALGLLAEMGYPSTSIQEVVEATQSRLVESS